MTNRFFKAISNNVLVGIFLTVPVVVTILIFNFMFNVTTNWLPERWFQPLRANWYGKYTIQFLTLMAILCIFFLVGLFVRNFFGRQLYRLGDKILSKIPVIKSIYISVRQISESLFTQRKTLFKEVVLVEYPRKGLFSLAFITAYAPPSITNTITAGQNNERCISLFISTTPNPTSGVFIFARESEIIRLKLPVADALTFIMSAGAVIPGQNGIDAPTLLDKLESWLKHETTPGTEDSDAQTTSDKQ